MPRSDHDRVSRDGASSPHTQTAGEVAAEFITGSASTSSLMAYYGSVTLKDARLAQAIELLHLAAVCRTDKMRWRPNITSSDPVSLAAVWAAGYRPNRRGRATGWPAAGLTSALHQAGLLEPTYIHTSILVCLVCLVWGDG